MLNQSDPTDHRPPTTDHPPIHNVRVLNPAKRAALVAEVAAIESYPEAVERVVAKAHQRLVRLNSVPPHAAMLLKQELLALGGDALITPDVYLGTAQTPTPILAWASERAWTTLGRKLAALPLPIVQQLSREIETALSLVDRADRGSLTVADQTWRWGERTLVMGIINVTPDSFSHDGVLDEQSSLNVTDQATLFARVGADILDIGGESTRPGATMVSIEEELDRVIPAIAAARAACALPISVDTYKADVARMALDAGAHLINDIWGFRTPEGGWNKALAALIAERNVPIILMHNRRAVVARTADTDHFTAVNYTDLTAEVCAGLRESVQFALQHGITASKIILDPGIGFGKTPAHNLEILRHLAELRSLGYPLLVGTSRKSFIGLALDKPVGERIFGTAATIVHAIERGADIVRVHDIAAMVDVCRMTDALVRQ